MLTQRFYATATRLKWRWPAHSADIRAVLRLGLIRGQPVGESPDVAGPGAAASADELSPVAGPGDRLLEVFAGRQAVEDPVRRPPVARLGVDADRPGVVTADGLDRVQGQPGVGVHHGDRGQ